MRYLDTSVIAAVLLDEANADWARAHFSDFDDDVVVADLAAIEFGAVVSRRYRIGQLDRLKCADILAAFDRLRSSCITHAIGRIELSLAFRLVTKFELKLRTADALHLAATSTLRATLVTFDKTLAEAARKEGLSVMP